MKFKFTVQHAQDVTQQKIVDHEGASATLSFQRKRVELVAEDHEGGTILLLLPPDTTGIVEGEVIEVEFLFPTAKAEVAETMVIAACDNASLGDVL